MPASVAAQAALLLHEVAGLRNSSVGREGLYVSLPYFGWLHVRHREYRSMCVKDDNKMASCTAADGSNFLAFDEFSFHDSMDWLGDGDWTSNVNFSLLDNWHWTGDGSEDL